MPRILPRLLHNLQETKTRTQYRPFPSKYQKKERSLYRPVPTPPSLHPANHSRSILFHATNPILHSNLYRRHKTLPPSIRRPNIKKADVPDLARQRTKEETEWWSNPYLRMLASPIRQCFVTERYMPTDFLVRLGPMRVSSTDTKPEATLSPDGIQHSKYTTRKVGKGTYVFCWRKAIQMLPTTAYKRLSQHMVLPDSLADHIAHLLRLRVLQELELLTEQVECAATRRFTHTSVLRRLTYEEWGQLRSTNALPCERALAVLVVPPLNKNPETGERPVPSMSPLPPQDQQHPQSPPPICELLPFRPGPSPPSGSLPERATPLYNAVSTFPSQSQRAAVHALLLRLLAAERKIKCQTTKISKDALDGPRSTKSSHGFLLSSSLDRDQHGDPAAVAVALWRLHMYERSVWSDTTV